MNFISWCVHSYSLCLFTKSNRLSILPRSCKLATLRYCEFKKHAFLIRPALLARFIEVSRLAFYTRVTFQRKEMSLSPFFEGRALQLYVVQRSAMAHPSRGMKFQFVGVQHRVAFSSTNPRRFPSRSSLAALRSLLSGVDREIKRGRNRVVDPRTKFIHRVGTEVGDLARRSH